MCRKMLLVFATILLLVALYTQAALAQTVLQLGDVNSEQKPVRVLQTRLCTLGYLAGEPTPPYKFDTKTRAAVNKFQVAAGLAESEAKATGVADENLLALIKLSTAPTYASYLDKIHTKGGSGEEVLATKTRLKKLGYLTGTLNNQYDQATETAVSCFQRANNLSDTGKADKLTRDVLFSDAAISMHEYQLAANLTVVKKGDSGTQVSVVQQQLSDLGYYTKRVTGTYTPETGAAIKLFKTAHGLTPNGTADTIMREILNSGKGKTFDEYTGEEKLRKVASGDKGYAVELLQTRLKELYYYSGKINGKFDAATATAVSLFQKGNSLSQTGVASEQTRQAMNSSNALDRIKAIGLLPGDNFSEVKDMTTRLKKLGYTSAVTSQYTKAVAKVVTLFQKANKLSETGKADPETLEVMYRDDAVTYDEYKMGSGNTRIEKMIKEAYKHLNKPYKTGSACNVPSSFDCSRYTKYVFGKVGVSLGGEVSSQAAAAAKKYTKIASMSDLKRGDLLYFDTQPEKKNIGHAAIYLGKNSSGTPQFIHASSSAGKVVVSVFSDWYRDRWVYGVRVWK